MENICAHFLKKQNLPGFAVKFKVNGEWKTISWPEYIQKVEFVAGGLKKKGVSHGTHIAIMSGTRVEWSIADLAILGLGAVSIPIYPSNTSEEMAYILNNSETQYLFVEDSSQLDKWKKISPQCPTVKEVFVLVPDKEKRAPNLSDLEEIGEQFTKESPGFYAKSVSQIKLSDLASIHYTSGTTGVPKGVSLTHVQVTSEVADVFSELGMISDDMTLTFLPFSHILGHVEYWGSIYLGYSIAYAESIDKIRDNLKEVGPTVLVAVPRIFEKIYNGVVSQAEINPTKKKIFNWACSVGAQVSKYKRSNKTIPLTLFLQYGIAQKLVFSKLHAGLGGKLKFCISGSAPLSQQIAEFFHAAGILILEGYGLTETTAAITLNRPHDYEFGTVGRALPNVKLKIAADGEVLVQSDKVMIEYYKNPEATKEVMHDGWFATGDIGELTDRGFLRLTDRKKDLIKTAGGKYVAPQKLENLLKLNKYISNVLIHGDQKKYVIALLTLNPDEIKKFAQNNDISYPNLQELAKKPEIQSLIRDVVANVNSQLASYETIKTFEILPNDFTIESGELTPSLKVKRKFCDKKYKEIIDSLYA